MTASVASVIVGAALVALSLRCGKRGDEHYGNWDRFVLQALSRTSTIGPE